MQQLIFDFDTPPEPGFEAFVGQGNRQIVHALQHSREPFLYLWGNQGSGKTHLLRAWAREQIASGRHTVYLDARDDTLRDTEYPQAFAIDHVAHLDRAAQAALFTLFNDIRHGRDARLLLAADEPPAALDGLREDVRTRLGLALIYRTAELSEDEMRQALDDWTRTHQWQLPESLIQQLLKRTEPYMGALIQRLEDLEQRALNSGRPLTPATLRALLP